MLSPDTFLLFLTASLLLCLAPGPDNIFVLTQAMLRGTASGILVTLGLCTGLLVHTSAVALGVAVIFQESLLAFTILKLCGAAYLLYLAWGAFRAGASGLGSVNAVSLDKLALYRRGIVMNITNPKVSIFFLAFLPQFTNPASGHLTLQLLELGAVFIVCTFLVFGLISVLAGKLGCWFSQSPKAEVVMNRIAGSVFAALAVKLALTQR
ncbi:LysE family translocator [Tolumonas auensis]|uniref:LysE family translocator n=1 Tax=Tolumonas auensis TaxID=43948 RepID=UPI002AA60B57|nr:LysE family translocator [Tolumonas auensis]